MVQKEKVTARGLKARKAAKQKIAMLTSYDFALAKIVDGAGIDIVLVGDSLGNVMLGYHNTLPVTMQEMVIHTQAVSRGVERALVIADMPFGSFQSGDDAAVSNAVDLVKAGAEAIKLEGAQYLSAIKKIIKAGIPVMGHLGFTPQSVNLLGTRVQGKLKKEAAKIYNDAIALEKAGCFALVLEFVPHDLAKKISRKLKIPVIGIGAGNDCDGQVLVLYDMLGIYENPPTFVKKYASLNRDIKNAVIKYIEDVRCPRSSVG